MICPNCKHNNPEGSKFCCQCAAELPQPLVCPKCGCKDIPLDSKFCPDCGTKIGVESTPSAETTSNIMVINVNGVEFKMIKVEGGRFERKETVWRFILWIWTKLKEIVQEITLSDYFIGETQVTQALWKAVMGKNPSYFKGDNLPVEQVSWDDCQVFISKLNSLTGKHFHLPTEAQWEFAARGGNKSNGYKYSGSNNLDDVAWYWGNSCSKPHPVATKQANELGIYDMSGNVWEWCSDWYGNYSGCAQMNPTGANSSTCRVRRGGCWDDVDLYSRSSNRSCHTPDKREYNLGLRLCLSE